MLNNFIYAKQKFLFEEKLNAGEVLDEAIVFIEDTKEIWNHGTYFDCKTFDPSSLEVSVANKADKATTLSGYGISDVNIDLDTVGSPVSIQIGNKNAELTTINDDFVAINNSLTLGRFGYNNWGVPYSTASQHGVVKIGEGLTCDENGVVSSTISVQDITAKQDKIIDLETIRQGAAKGATALQSYTEQYKGTVTGVKINGTTKNPSSGVVDLGYVNKQLSTSTSSSMTLSPNIYYRNTSTSLSTLTIKLGSVSNSNIINEYFVEFTTRSSGTTISLPSTIKWANGETPTFEASTTYQISIINNLGVVTKFK